MTVAPSRDRRERLDPHIFDLPSRRCATATTATRTSTTPAPRCSHDGKRPRVLMQVFQRQHAMLGGMDEAIAILELCSRRLGWAHRARAARRRPDEPWETVMTIEGDYTLFAHLETVCLGTLARRTLIATNTARVLEAANGKPIIFMPARHDHHRVQTGDGYAAHVAGAVRAPSRGDLGRPGVVVGRPRRRHGAALADRGLRREHGARRDEVRRLGARGLPHHRPRRLRERLRADGARGRPRARPEALGRPARHLQPARRPLALGRARRLRPAGRERAPRPQGARRARRGRVRAGADRRLRRVHGREDRSSSSGTACRSTRTASAPR